MPQVVLVAGEASGDANGAALARELRRQRSDLDIWGAGGPRMKEAGVNLISELSSFGAIGVFQSLKVVPRLYSQFKRIKRQILSRRPDVFVPIDFGAFNVRLASSVKDAGVKVAYYFPPSSWRRETRNHSRIRRATDVVITPFPWSEEILRMTNIDARFVGHPLLDIARPEQSNNAFRSKLPNCPLIGILPGSRYHEIGSILPTALEACLLIREQIGEVAPIIGAAAGTDTLVETIARTYCKKYGVRMPDVITGKTYDVMAHSDFLIACSGTATLEAAILGTPMVIVYKGPWIMKLEYLLRRNILQGGFAGLPNIIAQREICPELLGDDASPEKIASAVVDLWESDDKIKAMKDGFCEIRGILGSPGATARAAQIILETGGLN